MPGGVSPYHPGPFVHNKNSTRWPCTQTLVSRFTSSIGYWGGINRRSWQGRQWEESHLSMALLNGAVSQNSTPGGPDILKSMSHTSSFSDELEPQSFHRCLRNLRVSAHPYLCCCTPPSHPLSSNYQFGISSPLSGPFFSSDLLTYVFAFPCWESLPRPSSISQHPRQTVVGQ